MEPRIRGLEHSPLGAGVDRARIGRIDDELIDRTARRANLRPHVHTADGNDRDQEKQERRDARSTRSSHSRESYPRLFGNVKAAT
jgi:hypothetical protein